MARTAPPSAAPVRGRTAACVVVALTLAAQASVPFLDRPALPLARGSDSSNALHRALSPPPPSPGPVVIGSAERLAGLFEALEYRLEAVGPGADPVPPVELASLPGDLAAVAPVDRRKQLFIAAVLPIVLQANEAVLQDRARLEALAAAKRWNGAERRWLREIAARYTLVPAPGQQWEDPAFLDRLLRRVDAVPVSLAVAQAILESGWGSSRFARTGNALFGQWTWDAAAGIEPLARAEGKTHRVRAFASLAESAHAYLRNLNTHRAYAGLRKVRADARAVGGGLPPGRELARHLTRYSERGQAYVQDIHAVIRQNRLDRLDGAVLGTDGRIAATEPPSAEADLWGG